MGIGAHLGNGGCIGTDAGFAPGFEDGVGCLKGVKSVNRILHMSPVVSFNRAVDEL